MDLTGGVIYLDVAIGIAVAFLLLSLIPSGIDEAIAFMTRIRSKFLWAYINQIFTKADADPAGAKDGGSAGAKSERSVLPVGATAGASPAAAATSAMLKGKPAAKGLPSTGKEMRRLMFARGDADPRPKVAPAAGDDTVVDRLHRQLGPIAVGSTLRPSEANKRTTTKHVPTRSLAEGVVEVLRSAGTGQTNRIDAGIAQLAGTPIHATLVMLWEAAESDVAKFRTQLEGWFDAEMARLSGLYKRVSRYLLFGAAVVVAVLVNLDPIALGRDLWRDPDRRAVFVDLADSATEAPSSDADADRELAALFEVCRGETTTTTTTAPDDRTDTTAATGPTAPTDSTTLTSTPTGGAGSGADGDGEVMIEDAAQRVEGLRTCVVDALDAQRSIGLLGDSIFEGDHFAESWEGDWQWFFRPFKLAAVALAVFVGAPFWYDVVRRTMGIRKGLIKSET